MLQGPRSDVTSAQIEYFILKPKAKDPKHLKTGEIVAVKIDRKWVKYKLLEGSRVQYKDSSYLWKMINNDNEILTKHLTPTKEWGVLCGVNNFMDLRELDRRYGSLSSRRTHSAHPKRTAMRVWSCCSQRKLGTSSRSCRLPACKQKS